MHKCRRRQPHYRLTPNPRGTPANIRTHHIFLENRTIDLHFAADSMGLDSFKFLWWAPYDDLRWFFPRECVSAGRSRSSKVIDLGTNRKRVCDFLLVRHSNLRPILHRFGDIEGFVFMTPPLFHPNFGGVPVAPDRPCYGQSEQVGYLKLFGREIIFEVFQPVWKTYLNVTARRTDIDNLLWHNRALCSIAQ